jgi:hypothetical protein
MEAYKLQTALKVDELVQGKVDRVETSVTQERVQRRVHCQRPVGPLSRIYFFPV